MLYLRWQGFKHSIIINTFCCSFTENIHSFVSKFFSLWSIYSHYYQYDFHWHVHLQPMNVQGMYCLSFDDLECSYICKCYPWTFLMHKSHIGINESILTVTVMKQILTQMNDIFCKWTAKTFNTGTCNYNGFISMSRN